MVKIKKVILQNFRGYKNMEFSFTQEDKIKNLAVVLSPNGFGKSTLLEAVNLLSNPYSNLAKDTNMAFRKMTYSQDFQVDYQGYVKNENQLHMEGIFETDKGDKQVVIETDGVKVCQLEKKLHGHAYFIDADNPMNMRRFQVESSYVNKFLQMAEIIYGFKCEVARKVQDKEFTFYTDLIIHKDFKIQESTKVHFKSMSDGERKIATLLSYLFDPCYIDGRDIVLIDNVDQHVYFRRHAAMIDKMLDFFPQKQFIITSHSGTLISHVASKYGKQYLYDLEMMKDGVLDMGEWAY